MDCSNQSAHKIQNLQQITTGKLLEAIFSVYENHEVLKADGNSEHQVEKVEKLLKSKGEAGDTQASFLLGQLYEEESHYTEAEAVFDEIKDGELHALYQLAVMYDDGLGTTADNSKAVDYMRRAAECGTGSVRYAALYNLGRAYLQGYGVQASREAFDWHSEACGNGSLESQGALGIKYLYGYGVSKDLMAALYCFTEAAARGNIYAQGHLTTSANSIPEQHFWLKDTTSK